MAYPGSGPFDSLERNPSARFLSIPFKQSSSQGGLRRFQTGPGGGQGEVRRSEEEPGGARKSYEEPGGIARDSRAGLPISYARSLCLPAAMAFAWDSWDSSWLLLAPPCSSWFLLAPPCSSLEFLAHLG